MNRYGRKHGSGNTSKGVYWILLAGVLSFGIYKAVVYIRNVNRLHDIEMEEKKYNNPGSLENYDPAADTIKKRRTPD